MTLAVHHSDFADAPQTLNSGPDYCSYQQFRLEVIGGPDTGKVMVSTGVKVVIGSDPGADLQLSDLSVASFQCEIIAREDRIDIIDLAHCNTTVVNDIEVAKAHLRGQVTISIGGSSIRFERISSSLHVRLSDESSFATLVGDSIAMRHLFVDLARAALSESPVLLEGEAGTGKEAAARAIHQQGNRCKGRFHVVNCAMSHGDVERGLIAAFEQAAGGTLYLDQVEEMSEDLQSRLLRVFKNGGPGAVADLRIIASSAGDLRCAINDGRFDGRLYGHLAVHKTFMPPLRQRLADVPRLVGEILSQLGSKSSAVAALLLDRDFLAHLQRYGWPGNVRELRSHLQHCLELGEVVPVGQGTATINSNTSASDAPTLPAVDISRPIKAGREEWIKHFERMYLADILEAQGGNVTRAAKAAGVDRGHFYRLMMRCGMKN